MNGHHHPIVLLAKLGGKWLLAGALLFLLFNPVSIGAELAIYDALTGGDTGRWLINGPQPTPHANKESCTLYENGRSYRTLKSCNRVQFPGKKVGA